MMTSTAPWHELATWIDTTPPSAVAVGLLRPAVLLLAAYLLVTTLVYVAARAARLPALVRATAPLTLPVIRRAADRFVAVGLVTATTTGVLAPSAALAAAPRPVVTLAADGTLLPPGLRVPSTVAPTPGATPGATPGPTPSTPAAELPIPTPAAPAPTELMTDPAVDATRTSDPAVAPATAPAASDQAQVHVVAPGEHLWAIAARQVAAARGVGTDALTDADVAPQWRRIVAANTPRLRSGDPDLIHPGETVVLPDLD